MTLAPAVPSTGAAAAGLRALFEPFTGRSALAPAMRSRPDPIPQAPPESVRAEVDAAARRYEQLRQMGRELHFRTDDGGTIVVDVCDLEGRVLRTVPPSEALDIMAGASPDGEGS